MIHTAITESFSGFIIPRWLTSLISWPTSMRAIVSSLWSFLLQVCKLYISDLSSANQEVDLKELLPPNYDHYQLESDSSAQLVARRIELWKNRCDQSHRKCFKPKNIRGQYPTRLLHIGDKITVCTACSLRSEQLLCVLTKDYYLPNHCSYC